jgi:hypothetical protein
MSEHKNEWDGEIVRKWLESRFSASRIEQDWADKKAGRMKTIMTRRQPRSGSVVSPEEPKPPMINNGLENG